MKITKYHYLCLLSLIIVMALIDGRLRLEAKQNLASVYDLLVTHPSVPVEYRENSTDYQFINPLLFIETDQSQYTEFNSLDKLFASGIKSATDSNNAYSVSIYMRDMKSGHWTGYNEEQTYEPSSLLKVAVLTSYYRLASHQSDISNFSVDKFLSQKIYYPGADYGGQNYPPSYILDEGSYTYKDLIEDMIINSDNVAKNILVSNNAAEFNKVYSDFRLPPPIDDGAADYMTARSYSVMFRTLYNSTYLPWDLSEKALQLLATSTFMQGLVASLPPDVVVAHKFGEHTNITPSGEIINHELHDCGIIYYPGHPYFLCVMTKGPNFSNLEKVIARISKIAYNWVDIGAKANPI